MTRVLAKANRWRHAVTVTVTYSNTQLSDNAVPTFGGEAATAPSIASLAGGGYVVGAQDSSNFTDLSFYSADGTLLGSNDGFGESNADLVQLSNGNVVVVGDNGSNVSYSIDTATGGGVGSAALTTNGIETNASVAAQSDANGGGFVVVDQAAFSGADHDIEVHLRNADGSSISDFAVTGSSDDDENASVATLANGNIVVAWERIDGSGNSTAWYSIYDKTGTAIVNPTEFDSFGTINHGMKVTAEGNSFSIAYEDNGWDETDQQITTARFDDTGAFLSYAQDTTQTSPSSEADITTLSNGFTLTTFTNLFSGTDTDIRATLHDASGNVVSSASSPLAIDFSSNIDSQSAVTALDLAQFAVTYADATNSDDRVRTFQLVRTQTGDDAGNTFVGDDAVDIENGGAGTDMMSGGANADTLTAGGGADTLDGGSGADTMIGGTGNDTYFVDNAGDVVTENAGEGTDLVQSSITYTLGSNLENLTLIGSSAINGTGNDLANSIRGNAAANTLTGNDGNDILNGLDGADTLIGGIGDDIYYVDNAGDTVTEAAGQGTDTVESAINYTLGDNVEKLTLTGTANINATGNSLANAITGNAGNNVLDGGAGADTLKGGAGNDTYIVDNAGDTVTENNATGGTDLVQSSVSFALGSNVENLTLTGSANINGTGNTLGNVITGNSGNNILNGGAGVDTLKGGAGDDTYIVDNVGDIVTENASGGTDLVDASVSLTLASNVENLTLTGSAAINGNGNTLANVITGNTGNNILSGGLGADTLKGGAGDDTYIVDNAGDTVTENSATGGTDIVDSSVSFALGANIENLTLTGSANTNATGNTLANLITGNTGNNILNGGAGADTMKGGSGDDTYVLDNAGDTVTENSATGGNDLVQSSVSFTLGTNLERLTLTGSGGINGVGNNLANTITGNSGSNVLNGGAGADTLQGGAGNDTYVVDNLGDTVVENSSTGGTDLVQSSVSFSLGTNIENLTLTGAGTINGIGNTLSNVLMGNAAANTLDGGSGIDTLTGGGGNDLFLFDTALGSSNVDTITDFTVGGDLIELDRTIFAAIGANGTLSASAFVAGTSATNGSQHILYNSSTGDIFYDSDGSGSAAAIKFAHVAAGTALTASSFTAIT